MSATAQAPAPGTPSATRTGPPAAVQTPAAPPGTTTAGLDEDVPSLLNRLQVLAVAACVIFAVGAGTMLALSWNANRAAANNTEQLVRVQGIESTLLRADALATNAFLVGGVEPTDRRADYDAAIDDATRQIADAAEAQPADREALATLNAALNRYTTGISQARDNNRQLNPVASEYLRLASSGLRSDALPVLDALVDANSQRADDELGSQHTIWVFLFGLNALVILFIVNRQLSRRFRRSLNPSLSVAFLAIAVLTLISTANVHSRNNGNDDLRDGDFRTAVDEATARTAANDAKASESLGFISQGSLDSFEADFTAAAQRVDDNASRETQALFDAFRNRHEEAVALVQDEGRYDEAVTIATTGEANGTTTLQDRFDTRSAAITRDAASATTRQLRDGNSFALVLAALSLGLGLVAAGLSVGGISVRRKEYS